MRDYKRETLYPYTRTLSSSEVLDCAKSPPDFYVKWVKPSKLEALGLADILGVTEKEGSAALHTGIAFGELYADRSFDYLTYMRIHKIPKRLVELVGSVIKYFPKPNLPEHELTCRHSGWTFRATLDDFYPQYKIIVEHKTSALLWTQEVVDSHDQVTFQQWVYWKKYGELCKHTLLNYVDTSTGARFPVQTFVTVRTREQLIAFEELVIDKVLAIITAENWNGSIYA